jgi:hypothetical protein
MAITSAIGDLFKSFYELFASILNAAYTVIHSVFLAVYNFIAGIFTLAGNLLGGLVDVTGSVGKFVACKHKRNLLPPAYVRTLTSPCSEHCRPCDRSRRRLCLRAIYRPRPTHGGGQEDQLGQGTFMCHMGNGLCDNDDRVASEAMTDILYTINLDVHAGEKTARSFFSSRFL